MKLLVIGLSLLSATAFGNTTFNTVKVADGKTAYCKSKFDLYRNKTGIYTAKATKAALSEKNISFLVDLKFLNCVKTQEGFGFVYKAPYSKFEYETLSNEEGVKSTVVAKAQEVRLKAIKDGVYKIISNQMLSNEVHQQKEITISLEEVLDQKQKDLLELNNSVVGSFDFWMSKKMNYVVEERGIKLSDLVNYGAFRVHFEISNNENGLQIKLL